VDAQAASGAGDVLEFGSLCLSDLGWVVVGCRRRISPEESGHA
jgi:hypothetical protein